MKADPDCLPCQCDRSGGVWQPSRWRRRILEKGGGEWSIRTNANREQVRTGDTQKAGGVVPCMKTFRAATHSTAWPDVLYILACRGVQYSTVQPREPLEAARPDAVCGILHELRMQQRRRRLPSHGPTSPRDSRPNKQASRFRARSARPTADPTVCFGMHTARDQRGTRRPVAAANLEAARDTPIPSSSPVARRPEQAGSSPRPRARQSTRWTPSFVLHHRVDPAIWCVAPAIRITTTPPAW
jgi:hypothetical protein